MRTTINLDEALLKRAKVHAAKRGITLGDLVERALRDHLREQPRPRGRFQMLTYGSPDRPIRHEPEDFAKALEDEDAEALRRA